MTVMEMRKGASRCMDMTGSFSSGTVSEYWSNGMAKSVGDIIGDDGIDDLLWQHTKL